MITPIRKQYLEIKKRYPQAILLFQMGDFYETFDEDAELVSRELNIALTTKWMGKNLRVPLAGFPCHSLEQYLRKLIRKGYKVAICDQLSPPGRGLVKRDVVRLITPGTVVESSLLEGKSNNYLASVVFPSEQPPDQAGIAYVDITTSEFATTQLAASQALSELERLNPAEILLSESSELSDSELPAPVTRLEDRWFELEITRRLLLDHFETDSLAGFGCDHLPLAVQAAGSIIYYLQQTQRAALDQLTRLNTYSIEQYMELDPQTLRNLEVFENYPSLLSVIDLTKTPMGGRLLKKWLRRPLLDVKDLSRRQDAVQWFYDNPLARSQLASLLDQVFDLERLLNRVRGGIATPRELVALGRSLEAIPKIMGVLREGGDALKPWLSQLKPCDEVVELISRAIVQEPPLTPSSPIAIRGASFDQGGVIKDGFSKELDQLRLLLKSSKKYLAELERRERERTGIKSLKVGYNKVFGYYIEVTKPNLHLVPPDYIRKQTLVGAERFFTVELKEYESLISNAESRILELESSIFQQVCAQVGERRKEILANADVLAQLDVFSALAEAAVRYDYVRPQLTEGDAIIIKGGRHPIVEQSPALKEKFVPNDTFLSNADTQIMILTGPNMSGKSTYLRQVALIVLLAQIGSFVPADSATIGLVDRIFTRVGLQDHLAQGRSSFMTEMIETANILNNATPKSLVILDEIGRGTSTYDGLSIARAVIEYLHNHPGLRAKTLFATHYHELTDLEDAFPRVKNFHITVSEEDGKIIFHRKVLPGRGAKSYGIQVARLAGLPRPVVHRAQEIVADYESRGYHQPQPRKLIRDESSRYISPSHKSIIEILLKLDLNSMTPVEAMSKLYELQKMASKASK